MTRPKADLLQGTLDLLILKALSLGPWRKLDKQSEEASE